ncbi:MAG: Regulator of polyketide synthase expression, partial [uncultured Rubrobacteraceae bacterium]
DTGRLHRVANGEGRDLKRLIPGAPGRAGGGLPAPRRPFPPRRRPRRRGAAEGLARPGRGGRYRQEDPGRRFSGGRRRRGLPRGGLALGRRGSAGRYGEDVRPRPRPPRAAPGRAAAPVAGGALGGGRPAPALPRRRENPAGGHRRRDLRRGDGRAHLRASRPPRGRRGPGRAPDLRRPRAQGGEPPVGPARGPGAAGLQVLERGRDAPRAPGPLREAARRLPLRPRRTLAGRGPRVLLDPDRNRCPRGVPMGGPRRRGPAPRRRRPPVLGKARPRVRALQRPRAPGDRARRPRGLRRRPDQRPLRVRQPAPAARRLPRGGPRERGARPDRGHRRLCPLPGTPQTEGTGHPGAEAPPRRGRADADPTALLQLPPRASLGQRNSLPRLLGGHPAGGPAGEGAAPGQGRAALRQGPAPRPDHLRRHRAQQEGPGAPARRLLRGGGSPGDRAPHPRPLVGLHLRGHRHLQAPLPRLPGEPRRARGLLRGNPGARRPLRLPLQHRARPDPRDLPRQRRLHGQDRRGPLRPPPHHPLPSRPRGRAHRPRRGQERRPRTPDPRHKSHATPGPRPRKTDKLRRSV